MPVGLARRQLGQENSKSVAIFISYPNLSMSNLPDKSRPGWRLSSPTIGGLFRPAIQLSQTIGRAVYASPAAIQHVRVDHGSRHICVTQKLLDRADVVAIFKQVRGKRMAERVRGCRLGYPGLANGLFHSFLQHGFVQVMSVFFSGCPICVVARCRKYPLPSPLAARVSVFAFQRIGQGNST